MNARTKLAAFAMVLVATFGGAFVVGSAIGPIDVPPVDKPQTPVVDSEIHGEH